MRRIPFYIAAPITTVDTTLPDGAGIPIEERSITEITHFQGQRIAAPGIEVRGASFGDPGASILCKLLTHRRQYLAPASVAAKDSCLQTRQRMAAPLLLWHVVREALAVSISM